MTRGVALAFVLVLSLVAAGCSDEVAPPIGDSALTEEVVERLLPKSAIEDAGGDASGLDRSIEDLLEIATTIDSTRAVSVEALWSVRWTGEGRPGLLMTITRYRDAANAHDALDQIELGIAYEAMSDPIGDRSALSPANANVGVAVTFISGRTLVALQLPVASDGKTLLNESQLLTLAMNTEAKF